MALAINELEETVIAQLEAFFLSQGTICQVIG